MAKQFCAGCGRDPQRMLAAACIIVNAFVMLVSMLVCYFVWKSPAHLELLNGGSITAKARYVLNLNAGIWFMLFFLILHLASSGFAVLMIYIGQDNKAFITLLIQVGVFLALWILVAVIEARVKSDLRSFVFREYRLAGTFYTGITTYVTSFFWGLVFWLGGIILLRYNTIKEAIR